ncbi:MAG: hypothetical protein ACRDWE_03200 [Acidimicrobiales bacterium]
MRRLRPSVTVVLAAAALVTFSVTASAAPARHDGKAVPRTLLVGTFHGRRGQYRTIQAAVNAAKPGDAILIGPGVYHTEDDLQHPPTAKQAALGDFGGVLITTPTLTVRGMNRNKVVLTGTKPGTPACDAAATAQVLGPTDPTGGHYGNNGIVVFEANTVWIDNLTVCNYLNGSGAAGNEIWWDGGSGTGKIGMKGYWGSYLTATTTYYGNETVAPAYGIFANSATGPANWNHVYASNFDDSGMYVGACRRVCDVTISDAWMEYDALGYSGTNSGGQLVIEHSRFDHNQDGFDTNTQILSDPPPPQTGDCPGTKKSKITHTRSCWVFEHNVVEDNNDSHAPVALGGYAAAGPTGTGMTIAGGRHDTIMDNVFKGNGAWGILFVPFPDSDAPFTGVTCAGSGGHEVSGLGCVYDPEGDALAHNTFEHDGYWKNTDDGDYGQITLFGGEPQNCFAGNKAPDGETPPTLETSQPTCAKRTKGSRTGGTLLGQVECDTGFGSCPAGAHYPEPNPSDVVLHLLPKSLSSMPNPCHGVPKNAWCKGGKPI